MHFVCSPSSKIFYLRYKHILFITAPRMVKALGISECCKVNICILYVDPHQRPFLDTNVFYLLMHSEWSKLLAFLSVVR